MYLHAKLSSNTSALNTISCNQPQRSAPRSANWFPHYESYIAASLPTGSDRSRRQRIQLLVAFRPCFSGEIAASLFALYVAAPTTLEDSGCRPGAAAFHGAHGRRSRARLVVVACASSHECASLACDAAPAIRMLLERALSHYQPDDDALAVNCLHRSLRGEEATELQAALWSDGLLDRARGAELFAQVSLSRSGGATVASIHPRHAAIAFSPPARSSSPPPSRSPSSHHPPTPLSSACYPSRSRSSTTCAASRVAPPSAAQHTPA